MSTNASTLDLKSFLCELVIHKAETLAADLGHVPADKLGATPMGVARSPLAFTAECIGFNGLVAGALMGKTAAMPPKEEIEAFFASIDSLEKAQAGLRSSAEAVAAGIRSADEAALSAEITAPWGAVMPLYKLASAAADHMNYHDGQVNYIQALYGDPVNHWA